MRVPVQRDISIVDLPVRIQIDFAGCLGSLHCNLLCCIQVLSSRPPTLQAVQSARSGSRTQVAPLLSTCGSCGSVRKQHRLRSVFSRSAGHFCKVDMEHRLKLWHGPGLCVVLKPCFRTHDSLALSILLQATGVQTHLYLQDVMRAKGVAQITASVPKEAEPQREATTSSQLAVLLRLGGIRGRFASPFQVNIPVFASYADYSAWAGRGLSSSLVQHSVVQAPAANASLPTSELAAALRHPATYNRFKAKTRQRSLKAFVASRAFFPHIYIYITIPLGAPRNTQSVCTVCVSYKIQAEQTWA